MNQSETEESYYEHFPLALHFFIIFKLNMLAEEKVKQQLQALIR